MIIVFEQFRNDKQAFDNFIDEYTWEKFSKGLKILGLRGATVVGIWQYCAVAHSQPGKKMDVEKPI
jgi:hypothetical protein